MTEKIDINKIIDDGETVSVSVNHIEGPLKWIKYGYNIYKCPTCGIKSVSQTQYCPDCGEKLAKIEHWHLEAYNDVIQESMKTRKWVSLNCEKENNNMATKNTTITKEMLKNEIEAKNAEIKELKKELEKVERYKQYDETAGEIAALRDSFVNAGFSRPEAYELVKMSLANALNLGFGK